MAQRRSRMKNPGLLGPRPSGLAQSSAEDFAWRSRPGLLPTPPRFYQWQAAASAWFPPPVNRNIGQGRFLNDSTYGNPRLQLPEELLAPQFAQLKRNDHECCGAFSGSATNWGSSDWQSNDEQHGGGWGRGRGMKSWGATKHPVAIGVEPKNYCYLTSQKSQNPWPPAERLEVLSTPIGAITVPNVQAPRVDMHDLNSNSSIPTGEIFLVEGTPSVQSSQAKFPQEVFGQNAPLRVGQGSNSDMASAPVVGPPRRRQAANTMVQSSSSSSTSDSESSSSDTESTRLPRRRGQVQETKKKAVPKRRVVPREKEKRDVDCSEEDGRKKNVPKRRVVLPERRRWDVNHSGGFEAIIEVLLEADGRICEPQTLVREARVSLDDIRRLSQKYQQLIQIVADGRVMLFCMAEICDRHLNNEHHSDEHCGLHVCGDWLTGDHPGQCKRGSRCTFGHDLSAEEKTLERFGLSGMKIETAEKILRHVVGKRRLPLMFCKNYFVNNGKCEHDTKCIKLHLCPCEVMSHEMKCEDDCPMNHDWKDPGCLEAYRTVGITVAPKSSLRDLKAKVRHRVKDDPLLAEIKTFQYKYANQEDGDVLDLEICVESLGGMCPRNMCMKLHASRRTYHWQISDVGGTAKWLNLPNFLSEDLEVAFSHLDDQEGDVHLLSFDEVELDLDDGNGSGNGGIEGFDAVVKLLGRDRSWKADFSDPSNMKILSEDGKSTLSLRRLSTPSSAVCKSSFATKFKWYFKDDNRWVAYGEVSQDETRQIVLKSQVVSKDLEVNYLGKQPNMTFVAGMFRYEIDFTAMTQRNTQTGKVRSVLRRPEKIPRPEPVSLFRAPPHWEKMKKLELVKEVDVQPGSTEYNTVQAFLTSRGGLPGGASITRLVRIQSLYLYNRYELKKTAMLAERNKDATQVNEQQLFHGTAIQNVPSIIRNGFMWQLAGTATGVAYGKGVYFGTNANVSGGYVRGSRHLFIAKVLVGRSVLGSNGLIKPPAPYDSTSGPNMFVIYEEEAMYPEFSVYY